MDSWIQTLSNETPLNFESLISKKKTASYTITSIAIASFSHVFVKLSASDEIWSFEVWSR